MYSDANVKFESFPNVHTITCKRKVHDKIYRGIAKCHPNDYDFENELTGQHYAFVRTLIKEMREQREEIKAELKALNHVYDILNQNNKVSKKSIECYTIRRQIKLKERDLQDIKDLINETQKNLRLTINNKDKLYNAIRKQRSQNNA